MLRLLTAAKMLVLGFVALISTQNAFASPGQCILRVEQVPGVKETVTNATLQTDSRTITILGWNHIEPRRTQNEDLANLGNLKKAMTSAMALVQSGNCENVNWLLENKMKNFQPDLNEHQRVMEKFKQVHRQTALEYIGKEYSSIEVATINRDDQQFSENFGRTMARCLNVNSSLTQNFKKLLLGPEDNFAKSSLSPISLVGVDNHDEKNKAQSLIGLPDGISEEEKTRLNPATKAVLEKLEAIYKKGVVIPDELITEVYTTEPNPELAKKLLSGLQTTQAISRTTYARSITMAENMFAQSGNGVLLVGHYHVPIIAGRLLQLCQQTEQQQNQQPNDYETPTEL